MNLHKYKSVKSSQKHIDEISKQCVNKNTRFMRNFKSRYPKINEYRLNYQLTADRTKLKYKNNNLTEFVAEADCTLIAVFYPEGKQFRWIWGFNVPQWGDNYRDIEIVSKDFFGEFEKFKKSELLIDRDTIFMLKSISMNKMNFVYIEEGKINDEEYSIENNPTFLIGLSNFKFINPHNRNKLFKVPTVGQISEINNQVKKPVGNLTKGIGKITTKSQTPSIEPIKKEMPRGLEPLDDLGM